MDSNVLGARIEGGGAKVGRPPGTGKEDRLVAAGLRVHATRADDLLPAERLTREAVRARETVFVCTKPR